VLTLDLHFTTWVDPVDDEPGHQADSPYVEMFWLPVLGPSATVFVRRVNLYLADNPDGFSIGAVELSRELGLGHSQSRHAPLSRAIHRCIRFGVTRRKSTANFAMHRVIAPLPEHLVVLLPPMLQRAHSLWPVEHVNQSSPVRVCEQGLPASAPWPTADLTGG
jgi:hypothetical protein